MYPDTARDVSRVYTGQGSDKITHLVFPNQIPLRDCPGKLRHIVVPGVD